MSKVLEGELGELILEGMGAGGPAPGETPKMTPGYFASGYWPAGYWQDDYWPDRAPQLFSVTCSDSISSKEQHAAVSPIPWYDEFEDDFVGWTDLTGNPVIQQAVRYHGLKAIKFSSVGDTCSVVMDEHTTIWTRSYFYLDTLPTGEGDQINLDRLEGVGGNVFYGYIKKDSGRPSGWRIGVQRGDGYGHFHGNWAPVAKTWYCLELKFVYHDTTGDVELWIDGSRKVNTGNIDTTNMPVPHTFIVGPKGTLDSGGPIYQDFVAVNSSRIGLTGPYYSYSESVTDAIGSGDSDTFVKDIKETVIDGMGSKEPQMGAELKVLAGVVDSFGSKEPQLGAELQVLAGVVDVLQGEEDDNALVEIEEEIVDVLKEADADIHDHTAAGAVPAVSPVAELPTVSGAGWKGAIPEDLLKKLHKLPVLHKVEAKSGIGFKTTTETEVVEAPIVEAIEEAVLTKTITITVDDPQAPTIKLKKKVSKLEAQRRREDEALLLEDDWWLEDVA